MKRLDALKELAAKVEAGDCRPYEIEEEAVLTVWKDAPERWTISGNAMQAYGGSLDAAKELHEAVLPGWGGETFSLAGEIVLKQNKPIDRHYGFADINPARAWLLAILSALIANEKSPDE